ncbi:MAG: hypothetical protein ABSD77_06170 [Verrucomicrobiota bacterium]|jgi:hypothetical protein
MLVTCPCNYCEQNIEFEAADFVQSGVGISSIFGQTIPCPHCGKDTILTMPLSKKGTSMVSTKELRGRTKLIVLGIAALVLAIIFTITWKFPDAVSGISVGVFSGGAAILVLIIAALLLVLAIFWLIFPWMVYSMLKKIERNTRK